MPVVIMPHHSLHQHDLFALILTLPDVGYFFKASHSYLSLLYQKHVKCSETNEQSVNYTSLCPVVKIKSCWLVSKKKLKVTEITFYTPKRTECWLNQFVVAWWLSGWLYLCSHELCFSSFLLLFKPIHCTLASLYCTVQYKRH